MNSKQNRNNKYAGKSNTGTGRTSNSRKSRSTKNYSSRRECYNDGSDGTDELKSKTNDPSWYATDPALLRDAASIPFSWSVGTPIDMNLKPIPGATEYNNTKYVVPGIMTLQVMPTFGLSLDKTSPLNIASTAMYSFVRHANSGHSNYAAPDLMIYATAFTQVYSALNWCQRLYGLMTLYSQRNRYLPKGLIECQNVNFDDILNNLANFRYGINLAISRAASFAVPANMSLFQREAFLYQNVYTEGETVKDQLYMYTPHGFMFYVEDETGSHLDFKPLSEFDVDNKPMTVQNILDMVNQMLLPLIGSEDINIMSGDILKAYGASGIIKLASLGEQYPIVPMYDKAVLEQMKNATILPLCTTIGLRQSKNKEYLISSVALPDAMETDNSKLVEIRLCDSNRILTTSEYDPQPSTVMENSRMMAISVGARTADSDLSIVKHPIVCGSEVVRYCYFWRYSTEGVLVKEDYFSFQTFDIGNVEARYTALERHMMDSIYASNFHYHPCKCLNWFKGTNDKVTVTYSPQYFFDTDNYAIIDAQTLEKLHETALMSMVAVPAIAKFSETRPYVGK